MKSRYYTSAIAALLLSGCATSQDAAFEQDLALMMSGQSRLQGAKLQAALAEAARHPLGSDQNPVRASMPVGQRAYLSRLRCADGTEPLYEREGSFGPGIYENIVDGYAVACSGQEPQRVMMDMYHAGYREDRPLPGFTITAP